MLCDKPTTLLIVLECIYSCRKQHPVGNGNDIVFIK